ncbi:hypothetical protein DM01DRAFT_1376108 [Hesseltinella vesiculosa]|uniref:Uncharacterized protein n=1 Tax=Hesseltinella vesiculosa TaxID=101127 RepID=A0A1X2GBB4_9FUNG|nr:hypothetical protein DM01DRAFT_1376108 [Hesseltinella vesiculosa]
MGKKMQLGFSSFLLLHSLAFVLVRKGREATCYDEEAFEADHKVGYKKPVIHVRARAEPYLNNLRLRARCFREQQMEYEQEFAFHSMLRKKRKLRQLNRSLLGNEVDAELGSLMSCMNLQEEPSPTAIQSPAPLETYFLTMQDQNSTLSSPLASHSSTSDDDLGSHMDVSS